MEERRKAHLAGVSPGTMLAIAIAGAGIVGSWYVMQDDIKDNATDIKELKENMKDTHKSLWGRMNSHGH